MAMREITVLVEDHVYAQLARRAKESERGTKPEHVAADWISHRARENGDLDRKFRDAGRRVDQMIRQELEYSDLTKGTRDV